MGQISVNMLITWLIRLRDQSKRSRKHCVNQALASLGFQSSSVSTTQFDALLIRAIAEHFDNSRDADVLLMAFGLLQGYHYTEIKSIGERRKKYLAKSNYLRTHPRKQEPYTTATDDKKEQLEENLRKAEDNRISSLADYLVEQAKKDGGFEKYVKSRIKPIEIPKPSYILLEDESTPVDGDNVKDSEVNFDAFAPPEVLHSDKVTADDGTPEEIDEKAAPPPEGSSATTGDQEGSYSKEKAQENVLDPPSNSSKFRIHIGRISIGPILSFTRKAQTTVNLSWGKNLILLILSVVVIITMVSAAVNFFRPQTSPENKVPPEVFTESETPPAEETSSSVEEILVSKKEIVLVPGETCPLKYRVLPEEAGNAPLSFVSSDPDTVTVSHTGVLTAYDSSQIESRPYQKVDITIQAESGVTETKTVVVNFAGIDQAKINEEVEAGFYVWPQVRLVGSKDWSDSVDAKVGDKVEFWIQYSNISSENQENVMIRDVLPQSLRYINGTTKLWNEHLNGATIDRNTIATTGLNIGHYGPTANAHIRFQAEVVEDGLVNGSNALFNWAQISAADVFLQDYVSVIVNKS